MGLSLGCCITTACCNALCCICSKCGAPRRVFARLGYVVFSLICVVFSIIMLYFGNYIFSYFNKFLDCPDDHTKDSCLRISAVYRMSFILAIFHLVLFLICLCKSKISSAIHEGAWPLKIIIIVALYICTFFINNSVLKVYGYITMVTSGIFLVYEAILLIDLACVWNSSWVSSYDSEKSPCCWMTLLIVFTAIFYAGGLTICILMYAYYYSHWWTVFITTLTIISGIIFSILTLLKLSESSSLFTCSLVYLFISCMNASVILSDPYRIVSKNSLLQIFLGLIFLYIVLFYVSGTTVESKHAIENNENNSNKPMPVATGAGDVVMEKTNDEEVKLESQESQEENLPDVTIQTALFHLLMMFASLYLAMVLTNWGAPNLDDFYKNYTDFSKEWLGFGMKLASQWITTLLFIWCLIAPKVCPGRDFS